MACTITGAVTLPSGLLRPNLSNLIIQDDTGGIYVDANAVPGIRALIGDRITIQGYVQAALDQSIKLVAGAITTLRHSGPVQPRLAPIEEVTSGQWDDQLVRVVGRAQSANIGKDFDSLYLGTRQASLLVYYFRPATAPSPFQHTAEGAAIDVTGIAMGHRLAGSGDHYQLRLRDRSDIRIIRPAPWLSVTRFWMFAGPAWALVLMVLAWGWTLKRGIHKKTTEIRRLLTQERQTALALESEVAQRKAAQGELKRSEQTYRFLFEGNPHPMWVFDPSTLEFRAVNDAAIAQYGYAREEFLSMRITGIRPPHEQARFAERLATGDLTQGRAGVWEHVRKDGATIQVEVSYHELSFNGHSAVLVLATDVTERTRMEREREEAHGTLQAILKASPVPIWAVDLNGRLKFWNEAAERTYGWRTDEVLHHLPPILDDAGRSQYLTLLDGWRKGECLQGHEQRRQRKDGSSLDVCLWTSPLRAGDGAISGTIGAAVDITEQKRTTLELKRLHHQQNLILNSAGEGIFGIDREGAIMFANPAACRMLGWEVEELIGKTGAVIYPWTGSEPLGAHGPAVSGCSQNGLFSRKDRSTFPVEYTSTRLGESDEIAGSVVVFKDITERAQAELLERKRTGILEMVAGNQDLKQILESIVSLVETKLSVRCCILRRQDGRLRVAAAPQLPPELMQAVESLEIGPLAACCGAAAYWGETVVTRNIASDPLWDCLRDLATRFALSGCWSVPICSGSGSVVGTLDVYVPALLEPDEATLDFLQKTTWLAAIAIEHRAFYDQLSYQATHDSLTGLPNRIFFEDRLRQALMHARRNHTLLGVLYLDLDRFKQINDTLSHRVGDALLREVATRFRGCLRETDTLARLGGDEFSILVNEVRGPEEIECMVKKLLQSLETPLQVEGYELPCSASAGISVYPDDGEDSAVLQRNADAAMYRAKNGGRNGYQWFALDLEQNTLESLEIESHLRHAVDQDHFEVHYQPQFTGDHELAGFEALLRLRHPRLGVLSPGRFIPIAEESGLIIPVGRWVLQEICRQMLAWQQAGLKPVKVSVNVSAIQFSRHEFCDEVASIIAGSGISPDLIELEITESVLMANIEESVRLLKKLRALGIHVSVDDFGTGYSSLKYLQTLPIDGLKIDQSFVKDIGSAQSLPLLQTMIDLARHLVLQVVGEGVETSEQFDRLVTMGCDVMQGYFLARPLGVDSAARLLQSPVRAALQVVPARVGPELAGGNGSGHRVGRIAKRPA